VPKVRAPADAFWNAGKGAQKAVRTSSADGYLPTNIKV